MGSAGELLDAALGYTRGRLPVFPCWPVLPMLPPRTGFLCGCGRLDCSNPGKHPIGALVPNGVSNAAINAARIRHWWTARPDANVAIATGAVVVLDVDPRHDGDASLAALERKHGEAPHTWRALTGGGGDHIFFEMPAEEIRNSSGKLGPARGRHSADEDVATFGHR